VETLLKLLILFLYNVLKWNFNFSALDDDNDAMKNEYEPENRRFFALLPKKFRNRGFFLEIVGNNFRKNFSMMITGNFLEIIMQRWPSIMRGRVLHDILEGEWFI